MWYGLVFILGASCGYLLGSKELDVDFKVDIRVVIGCLAVACAYCYCVVRPLLWLIDSHSKA
jgi:hypothetical protein